MAILDPDRFVALERLLHAFARIERTGPRIEGSEAKQNDVEHSFFLAMLAWYAIDAYALPLDTSLAMRYALIHDLVEVYAGDSFIFDAEAQRTQEVREGEAQKQLAEEFPEFESLHKTIAAYEAQADDESKFVKALDKVEPVILNFMQNGRGWKEINVGFNELVGHKRERLTQNKEIRELFEEIIARIEPRKDEYFVM